MAVDLDRSYFRLRTFRDELPNQEREILVDNRIWFGAIRDMDDVFEGRPRFIFGNSRVDRDEMIALSRRMEPDLTEAERQDQVQRIVDSNANPVIREITMAWQQYDEEQLYASSSVCCFSKGPPTQRQWHYYAGQGKGYALIFDLSHPWRMQSVRDGTAIDVIPRPVHYSPERVRPTIELSFRSRSTAKHWKDVERALLTKSKDWDDQLEYRFVRIGLAPRLVDFPPESLVGVAFGYEMSAQKKDQLVGLLQERSTPVELFEARVSATHLAIDLVQVA